MSADDVLGPEIEVEPGSRFAIVPEWLIFSDVSNRDVRVYAALAATWSDWSSGACWPKRSTIAARLGISVDTVDRAIAKLAAAGAVRVQARYREDGSQASNKLWIVRERPADLPSPLRSSAAPPPRFRGPVN